MSSALPTLFQGRTEVKTRRVAKVCVGLVACLFVGVSLLPAPEAAAQLGSAQATRTDTPSGYPVPRFVSIKAAPTNCRVGPSTRHQIHLTYRKPGVPVQVIAETSDHWRRVIDPDGDSCWIRADLLSGVRTAVVTSDATPMNAKPDTGARARARLAAGVIARILRCNDGWCAVRVDDKQHGQRRGWVRRDSLWGGASL